MQNLKNQISEFKTKVKNYELMIKNKLSNKLQLQKIHDQGGYLIQSTAELQFLKECISLKKSEHLNIQLIYKATKHGDNYKEFDKQCNGKGQCFILIKSRANKKFGGYRLLPFERWSGLKEDLDSFIFSLDKMTKSKPIPGKKHLYDDYGLCCFNCTISIDN